ncbi:MAG: hypothetical protein JXO48_03380 [Deltaproteobacteria bacterium]|nr:hypothetical protein [Deltaproteobacteria bacterium]
MVEKISLDYGFLKTLFLRLMMKKIYECECVIKKVRGVYLIGIDREFLERHNIETVDNKDTYYEQIAEAIKDRQIELKKCQNLFLYQDFSNVTWQRSINAIYDLLNKKDFVVKSHPSKKIAEAALRNMCQYPKHLPSELIFGNIDKNVVAIYSSSLISASKFSHLKAISLIELVEWRNNDYKMFLKKDLVTNSNGKIFFPESFDELSALL